MLQQAIEINSSELSVYDQEYVFDGREVLYDWTMKGSAADEYRFVV
jgi:hypothetical protein